MDEYKYPKDFSELISMLIAMEEGDWADNDDTGHLRYIEKVSMCGGNYLMCEDHEVVGVTFDVMEVAQFIAEGWEYNE